MKIRWHSMIFCLVAVMFVGSLVAEEAEKKIDWKKVKCVVSGKAAKETASVDYKDAKLYFCCEGCPKKFAQDTEKFAAKANHQLVLTHQAKQKKCALTGRDLNPETAIEIAGVKVCFCCANCQRKAKAAEGDEQINLVFNDKAFEKGFELPKKEKASN